jgi:hypothetical protein
VRADHDHAGILQRDNCLVVGCDHQLAVEAERVDMEDYGEP